MFEEAGWFAIDARNRRVAGVDVASLDAGLALIGRGAVATIVGRLRGHVRVVDVDVEGDPGRVVAEAVVVWAAERGLWTLTRPSGGADGRTHVFVVPGTHLGGLEREVARLRRVMGVAARAVDLRRFVRPLTAPHRTGRRTRPVGDLRAARAALPDAPRAGRDDELAGPRRARPGDAPLARSRPRRRTSLPAEWGRYLQDGVAPGIGGQDRSRSAIEAVATGHLVRAGYTADQAWQAIAKAHPAAMGKARERGRRWWVRYVWNPAVADDAHFRPPPQPRLDPAVAAAVRAGRDRLDELQWEFSPRRRPALLLVGHHLLDRMERTNRLRVPCPERDLQLDTGLRDRKTIRAALRALDGPLGALDTTAFDPAHRADSSYEFEIPLSTAQSAQGGVSQNPPPSLHAPVPSVPRGIWRILPPGCHAVWRQLLRVAGPWAVTDLARWVGVTRSRRDDPSVRQVRTVREALRYLGRVGLAICDAEGGWMVGGEVTQGWQARAERAHGVEVERVAAERAAYREGQLSAWSRQRAAVLKANRAREQAWWDGLPGRERARRRAAWTGRFRRLSVADQHQVKARLADRRIRAGQREAARHDRWLARQDQEGYLRRVEERTAWFAGLAPPLRQAYVVAWKQHRARYEIPRAGLAAVARREQADLLPDTRAGRADGDLRAAWQPDRLPLEFDDAG